MPDLSRFDDWLTWLPEYAAADPDVRCVWVGGSAVTGGWDEWSDLDVDVLTTPGTSVAAYGRLLTAVRERFTPDHVWEMPEGTRPDGRQCFVNPQPRAGLLDEPTLILDLSVVDVGDHRVVDVRRHGTPLVLHDPDGLLELRHDDPAALGTQAAEAVDQIRQRFATVEWLVNRATARGAPARGGGALPAVRADAAGPAAARRALSLATRLRAALPGHRPAGRRGRPGHRTAARCRPARGAVRGVPSAGRPSCWRTCVPPEEPSLDGRYPVPTPWSPTPRSPMSTNWAQNLTYRADRVHRPSSVAELQELVAGSTRLKALGTRHCFNDIADVVDGDQVDVSGLPPVLEIDSDRAVARVERRERYGELAATLDAAGFALPNLASLPHISVAGAVATGDPRLGRRATATSPRSVAALELVTADGELLTLRPRRPRRFAGAVVGLGALGVVTTLTLDVCRRSTCARTSTSDCSWEAAGREHFDAHLSEPATASACSPTGADAGVNQVWVKRRVATGGTLPAPPTSSARAGRGEPSPPPDRSSRPRTAPSSSACPAPWHERLPHFRLEFTPSSGEELQTGVPRAARATRAAAIDAVARLAAAASRRCCRSPSCARSRPTTCG